MTGACVQMDGSDVVLNGRKWWTSGAMDPRCKVAIFMGRQMDAIRDGAPRHQQHSMVLVPMDHPGVEVRAVCYCSRSVGVVVGRGVCDLVMPL